MLKEKNKNELLDLGKAVLEAEADAIREAQDRLDDNFIKAVELIKNHKGKVIVTGIGKSGHIGQKISATLCSTGTPAVFLHAAEAVHGDLGIYCPGDPTILLSKSGATSELVRLLPVLRQFKSPLIAIVGNLESRLAYDADVVLDASVTREADPLGVVPTTSSVVALVLGDALASALMFSRRFTEKDFAKYHPGGQLGRNLLLQVKEVMHKGEKVAYVAPEASLKEVVIAMTQKPLGSACVIDKNCKLIGVITDGDVRRALQDHDDIRILKAGDVMTINPIHVHPETGIKEAISLMEERSSQISVLPVIDPKDNSCLGLIRIHDVYQSELT